MEDYKGVAVGEADNVECVAACLRAWERASFLRSSGHRGYLSSHVLEGSRACVWAAAARDVAADFGFVVCVYWVICRLEHRTLGLHPAAALGPLFGVGAASTPPFPASNTSF